MERRGFLQKLLWFLGISLCRIPLQAPAAKASATHGASKVSYGMGVDVDKCIGCGKCIEACRAENHVPGDFFHRTWVERYIIEKDGEVLVHSIDSPDGQSGEGVSEQNVLRSFFVPKLCNHCDNPPCCKSARWERRSRRTTASSWWMRNAASGAATASRPVRTAPASSTR